VGNHVAVSRNHEARTGCHILARRRFVATTTARSLAEPVKEIAERVIRRKVGEIEVELAATAALHHGRALFGFNQERDHGRLGGVTPVAAPGLRLRGLTGYDLGCWLHLCIGGVSSHHDCSGYTTNAHQQCEGGSPKPAASTGQNSRAHGNHSPSASPQQLVGY